MQFVLAKFGGKFSAGIAGGIAGAPATQPVARQAIGTLISGTAAHVLSQSFSTTVGTVFESLRGKDVTWGDYVNALTAALSNPTGWFMVAISSGVHLGAQAKVANAVRAQGDVERAPAKSTGANGETDTLNKPPGTSGSTTSGSATTAIVAPAGSKTTTATSSPGGSGGAGPTIDVDRGGGAWTAPTYNEFTAEDLARNAGRVKPQDRFGAPSTTSRRNGGAKRHAVPRIQRGRGREPVADRL